ncbi:putative Sensor protein KdpD [Streptomyces afghaniensis 772]|uniref:Putative Sensor protein KdpD n=1 Tax=Streptomyces afghaniensis 772 TaxID=1283301 RepID=S4MZ36_9ACTN|nr:putative Sensor protein KdpD [Streptomyces afghaniensis 772]
MGDDVHVEVGPGLPGDGRADTGSEDVLPGLAARGAQDDLRGVHPAGEGEQRGRYVVADHVMERSAEVLDEGPLHRQFLGRGRGQPVAAGYVDGEYLAAGALLGQPRRPADERPALGPAGQADHDPLARAPDPRHPVVAAVLGEVGVDPVGHPEQRQLAQGGQVAGAEVVRQGRVDLVGCVDVAVRHPPPQRLGRHVDQLDLAGPPYDLVRHGLLLPHTGDRLDDVAEGLQVLDVDGRDDVDACREQFLHVLPALGVAGAGDVRVCEFVHQGDLRAAGEDGVEVHLREDAAPVLQLPARHLLQPVQHQLGAGPAVVLDEGDHAVGAPLDAAVRLGQHRVRLADARCRTEVDPKVAACHGPIVFRSAACAASSLRPGRAAHWCRARRRDRP